MYQLTLQLLFRESNFFVFKQIVEIYLETCTWFNKGGVDDTTYFNEATQAKDPLSLPSQQVCHKLEYM